MANKKKFYCKSVDLFPLPTLWDQNKVHSELQTAEFGCISDVGNSVTHIVV